MAVAKSALIPIDSSLARCARRSWRSARNAAPAPRRPAGCTSARRSRARSLRGSASRNASASCGSTPAFCASAPVLISTNSCGLPALPRDLLGQRLAQARPVDRMDGVEQRHRLLGLVRLQRPDQVQLEARGCVRSRSAGHFALPPARGSRRTRAGPAAITGTMASASKVFDTATSVTEAGSRDASRQARAISRRTAIQSRLDGLHGHRLIHNTAAKRTKPGMAGFCDAGDSVQMSGCGLPLRLDVLARLVEMDVLSTWSTQSVGIRWCVPPALGSFRVSLI